MALRLSLVPKMAETGFSVSSPLVRDLEVLAEMGMVVIIERNAFRVKARATASGEAYLERMDAALRAR